MIRMAQMSPGNISNVLNVDPERAANGLVAGMIVHNFMKKFEINGIGDQMSDCNWTDDHIYCNDCKAYEKEVVRFKKDIAALSRGVLAKDSIINDLYEEKEKFKKENAMLEIVKENRSKMFLEASEEIFRLKSQLKNAHSIIAAQNLELSSAMDADDLSESEIFENAAEWLKENR